MSELCTMLEPIFDDQIFVNGDKCLSQTFHGSERPETTHIHPFS